MLGVIHRCVLGKAPLELAQFFTLEPHTARQTRHTRSHSRRVAEVSEQLHRDYLSRSALGYIHVYNSLPDRLVEAPTTKLFQGRLQAILVQLAREAFPLWQDVFNARLPRLGHPVRHVV